MFCTDGECFTHPSTQWGLCRPNPTDDELPDHEQQLLANLSAAALGDMLHLKNSATHQKQSGTLSVALRILGSRSSREVMLDDLINLLEDEDPELTMVQKSISTNV